MERRHPGAPPCRTPSVPVRAGCTPPTALRPPHRRAPTTVAHGRRCRPRRRSRRRGGGRWNPSTACSRPDSGPARGTRRQTARPPSEAPSRTARSGVLFPPIRAAGPMTAVPEPRSAVPLGRPGRIPARSLGRTGVAAASLVLWPDGFAGFAASGAVLRKAVGAPSRRQLGGIVLVLGVPGRLRQPSEVPRRASRTGGPVRSQHGETLATPTAPGPCPTNRAWQARPTAAKGVPHRLATGGRPRVCSCGGGTPRARRPRGVGTGGCGPRPPGDDAMRQTRPRSARTEPGQPTVQSTSGWESGCRAADGPACRV
ncbi:hypothetical protein GA0115240_17633 [Streptomyces sp. DvalAA-14]|nr:hypothetical protein GA0115240_17633 [Streptomyces sp. DvalAA-14]